MSFTDFLDLKLINTDNVSITPYHLLVVIVIFITTWLLLRLIKRIIRRQERRKRVDVGTGHAIFQIIKYILIIIAISLALESFDIDITFLLASSAALLVGLGLGLQQIFQDFISGIAIIIEGTLKAGDVVQMSDGTVGRVKDINMRTSKVETRENITLIVPNSKLINEIVVNWSHAEKNTRFSVTVGVAYGSDIELVRKVLLECAAKNDTISQNPPPKVRFTDFGDSSLQFELLFFSTQTFRVEDIKSDLRFLIDEAFQKHNIRIPFPQRDVHMFKE